jgi:glyoxylase-like metal-dependent hydrolase (beta-lactamase superfamily II)/ferredoxin
MGGVARTSLRLPQNAAGDLFVDSTCIDCDTCRQLAPETFARADEAEASFVHRQPRDEAERTRALMALVACPTASIGTVDVADVSAAARRFPLDVGGGVHFCGFTSKDSFGAWAWLVVRPDGNVLVDSPRAAGTLLSRIEGMGGVRTMFLTHRDDVADHEAFRRRFGCERVLHARDLSPGTARVERVLEGDEPIALGADLVAVPVPGHTAGSTALLYRGRDLFSGDHLWATDDSRGLAASRSVCWHSWPEQVRSIERLLAHPFVRVLPGHGPVYEGASVEEAHLALRALLARVGAVRSRDGAGTRGASSTS